MNEKKKILFRGIALEDYETNMDYIVKGDWVYGFYKTNALGSFIIARLEAECGGLGSGLVECEIPVEPESVEQYTNERDEDGNEIYVGCVDKPKKKLYKIWQDVNTGWDTYESAVVCAMSEYDARRSLIARPEEWCVPEDVQVLFIGYAEEYVKNGVIVEFYNRG